MTTFTEEQRELIRRHYDHLHECHGDVVEEAKRRGFRLAAVEDRELLSSLYLYYWAGTLWIKLTEIN